MKKRLSKRELAIRRAAVLLSRPRRRNEIIEVVERVARHAGSLCDGTLCVACRAVVPRDRHGACVLCGWEDGQPCAETTRRQYLVACACCAVWGLWAIPCMQRLRVLDTVAIHALCQLARFPERAGLIATAVHPLFGSLPDISSGSSWPLHAWPRQRKGSLFTLSQPQTIAQAFRGLEVQAWKAFQLARWPDDRALCPECGNPALFHDNQYMNVLGRSEVKYRRWRCLNDKQRRSFNEGRREQRREVRMKELLAQGRKPTVVRRNTLSTRGGCGTVFSDLDHTPFGGRHISLADWLILFYGDAFAIEVFQAIGIGPQQRVEMIGAFCTLSEQEPDFIQRWGTRTLPLVVMVDQTCKGAPESSEHEGGGGE